MALCVSAEGRRKVIKEERLGCSGSAVRLGSVDALGSCAEFSQHKSEVSSFSYLSCRRRKGEVYQLRQMNWDSLSEQGRAIVC